MPRSAFLSVVYVELTPAPQRPLPAPSGQDILSHAYRLARVNAGAPGVDGMTFAQIEKQGLEAWLAGLRMELVLKTYRPDPVRRAMIPKANGGERPLGIPTIRDRVIQTAAKIVIEPIFEVRDKSCRRADRSGRWPPPSLCSRAFSESSGFYQALSGSSPITFTSPSSKAHQKSGPFAPPALPGISAPIASSDSRRDHRLMRC